MLNCWYKSIHLGILPLTMLITTLTQDIPRYPRSRWTKYLKEIRNERSHDSKCSWDTQCSSTTCWWWCRCCNVFKRSWGSQVRESNKNHNADGKNFSNLETLHKVFSERLDTVFFVRVEIVLLPLKLWMRREWWECVYIGWFWGVCKSMPTVSCLFNNEWNVIKGVFAVDRFFIASYSTKPLTLCISANALLLYTNIYCLTIMHLMIMFSTLIYFIYNNSNQEK